MILIGYDESERIAFRTGLYVIHFKRAKYADPSDALRGVVTAPARGDVFDSVSGRTRYDASFVAKVVADKVENAIPLERQAQMFGNEGLPVAPSTLEDLYKRTADALLPLYERMVDRIMQCDILHVKDARLNIDNNPAERLNRGIAIIRKNCLFAGSEAGGQRLAILLFVRRDMQRKRRLFQEMARRRSASFEFHSGGTD